MPVLSVFVLVDVIPKMDDIVDRVFARRVPVCIEKSEGKIATGVNGKADLRDQIILLGGGFGTAHGARDVGIADTKLVIILGVWLEVCSFYLRSCQLDDLQQSMTFV